MSGLQSIAVFHSNIIHEPLNYNLNEIANFLKILKSCIGPGSKLKIIQNSTGGHVTVTSTSSRLFHVLPLKNMFLKLVVSSAVSHVSEFNNYGLYCCAFSLCLLENGIKSELPTCLLSELIYQFGKSYLEFLKSLDINCHHVVQFTGLSGLSNVIHSIISSKPGCVLTPDQTNKLSLLLLHAFLNSFPSSANTCIFENVSYNTEEGFSPSESKLYSGILIKVPYIYNKFENHQFQTPGSNKDILVALISVSFAGDVEFASNQVVEHGLSIWQKVLIYLKSLANKLIFDGVQIVFCQKVIHPSLRKLIEGDNILVFDRLGLQVAQDLEHVTGAVPVASLCDMKNITYGLLTSAEVIDVGTKKYFNFQNKNRPYQTIYLCNYNEEALSETAVVCRQVMKTLYRLLKKPIVCCGAGCTEIHVAHLVKKEVLRSLPELAQEYSCSTVLVLKALEVFLTSVHDIALTVNQGSRLDFVTECVHNHLWKMKSGGNFPSGGDTCQCGKFTAQGIDSKQWCFLERTVEGTCLNKSHITAKFSENSPVIVDELCSKTSATAVAFETVSLLLRIGLCISSNS